MCGIAGIISPHKSDHDLLEVMTDTLRHRGPDNRGFFRDEMVGLGHRRLSIIDLSAEANQPMSNEDGSIHLVCNGEIYNYKEKTADLKAKGHVFKSSSDCETLIHLYEEYDTDFLEHVNGMFAFALWDERKKCLLAAVDRFGKKPLYFASVPGRLVMASEMKSLLPFPWVEKKIDPRAIDRYLSLRYVPAPMTVLKSVKKLEPATMMIYREGKPDIRRYWKPQRREEIHYDDQAVDAFQELFSDAVKIRMQSDVPLGIYLSGGVDSCAVAGVMRSLTDERVVSYTLSIDYKYNERERAEKIAGYLGYEFNPVTVSRDDFHLLPSIMFHLDEPFGDLLCIPSYILARETKKKLTVTLTGDGADEILTGYFHQKVMANWERWKSFFSSAGTGTMLSKAVNLIPAPLLDLFFDYPDRLGHREKRKLSQTLSNCGQFGTFYEGITSCFTQEDKNGLYSPSLASQVRGEPLCEQLERDIEAFEDFPFYTKLSLLDLKYWIPFSVIFRLDKLNMAHAVETRSPFLDYRVVEMALNLSDEGKLNKNRNKELLRRLIERLFPPPLREKGKQAFYMPLPHHYRQPFYEWVTDLLTRETIDNRGLFGWPYVEGLLTSFQKGESMLVNRQLTTLAMLELWYRTFIDHEILEIGKK